MAIRLLVLGLAATLIACVHVPSEVEATFAPRDPGEASNFHRGSRPAPFAPAPAPALSSAPAPSSVPAATPPVNATTLPAAPKGGDA